jgi:hypothetical protein
VTTAHRHRGDLPRLRASLGMGASVLVLVTAPIVASAASAATVDVTSLPTAITMSRSDIAAVSVPAAPVCIPGAFDAFVAGRQDAITLRDATGANTARCSGTTLLATVTPTASTKSNAVVKFRLVRPDNSRVVMTLVIHLRR